MPAPGMSSRRFRAEEFTCNSHSSASDQGEGVEYAVKAKPGGVFFFSIIMIAATGRKLPTTCFYSGRTRTVVILDAGKNCLFNVSHTIARFVCL
jgi:hypothetical protein